MLRTVVVLLLAIAGCAPVPVLPSHIPPGHGWLCGDTQGYYGSVTLCNRECNQPPCHASSGAWCWEFNAQPECFEREDVCRAASAHVDPELRAQATECSFEP